MVKDGATSSVGPIAAILWTSTASATSVCTRSASATVVCVKTTLVLEGAVWA
jgi:hypothetical protein